MTQTERPAAASARDVLRPLIRTRQYREFTDEPVPDEAIDALADVARWSGSASNRQPWRFVVIRSVATLRELAEIAMPQTRSLRTATAAIAIAVPDEEGGAVSIAFDEGRAAERILVGAAMLGLGAGISWIRKEFRPRIGEVLGIPDDHYVRTIVAIGHPTDGARAPKSAPGEARLPREDVVFEERWSAS